MNKIQATAALALALCLAPAAWAGGNTHQAQAQRQYERERAHCISGHSQQDRATCLKEANAAYQEARRGTLANPPDTDLAKNATRRCQAQPRGDRDACVQRIMGAGQTEGSVKAGGLIRRSETTVR
jgi:hypothetical protein